MATATIERDPIEDVDRSGFHDVGHFHHKFELDNTTFHEPGPREVTSELLEYRLRFLEEELDEFYEALHVDYVRFDVSSPYINVDNIDHARAFDALIDLVYVAYGTAHFLGYPWAAGWKLVQEANMAKERAAADGSDSKRGSSFDVVKPEGWTPPDIEGLLVNAGW